MASDVPLAPLWTAFLRNRSMTCVIKYQPLTRKESQIANEYMQIGSRIEKKPEMCHLKNFGSVDQ
jgi:hypothetical protein